MWLDQFPQDFFQPPDFPGLVTLLAYLELNFPGSALERQAQLLLSEPERREPTAAEAEGEEDSEPERREPTAAEAEGEEDSEPERREPTAAEAEEPAPEPGKKRPQEATPTPVASPEPEWAPGTAFTDLHEAEEPPAACGQLPSAPARPVVPGPGPQPV
ncbi:ral guanine nucleotide dissociation stimulator-like [Myotis myotis]|uniref:ral guanine nucleotide dissociation stimulator-like n=1 Tax=Myotis myotis TaxID=51298 RepID=UPI001749C286|nr:ral guanine nucleotide dissociation stimulator-like [Myotis myotis]